VAHSNRQMDRQTDRQRYITIAGLHAVVGQLVTWIILCIEGRRHEGRDI